VKFIGSYQDRTNLYIVTEKCTGGEVFDRLLKVKRFSEEEVISVAKQALEAIAYIHSKNIIHRDIKAENFLYLTPVSTGLAMSPNIKLIDFGLAVRLRNDSDMMTAIVGSAHYLAPEMIRQQYSKSVDIWSVGVMVYLMLYGRYPFDGNNDDIVISKIRKSDINWNISDISNEAKKFIQALLERDVRLRPTATEAIRHPFLSSCRVAVPVLVSPIQAPAGVGLQKPAPQLESSSTAVPTEAPSEDQYPIISTDMEYYYSISSDDLAAPYSGKGRVPALDNNRGILRSLENKL
jgi:serine/threonine protein kinase